ncbi:30S ribosomal protein S9 [Candidatus Daviesbacteria bacterium]|nr:30S ribosomal protein S9 [Candidatus Daviesbacteria bacterium]
MAQTGVGNTSSIGRRKEAVARVRLVSGKGTVTVNGKPIHEYFSGPIFQKKYTRPIEITQTNDKYAFSVKVEGGGVISQLSAVVHGIARAIALADPAKRSDLKKAGLLTRDARVKERRKYGLAHKARAKKQSPKR